MTNSMLRTGELMQDFVDVTVDVLVTMAGMDVVSRGVREINGNSGALEVTACMDITGLLGFSGGRKGALLMTMPEEIALKAVGGMLGMELTEVDEDVCDGVGELINVIAGGAKTKLQKKGFDFELSIPNTVIGKKHQITAPASTSRMRCDFEADGEGFFIEVYMKED
ncbi:chemotaxis protein CheX [candidate division KSB1 bacterium]|nr:chemotaxis protein CheX [candidate division KSB1 bacterium]